jgi:hypothetical protein
MNARRRYDVAFYVPWLGPLLTNQRGLATGGAETQIFLLSRELARRGLRVCLLVFDIPGVHLPSAVGGVDVVVRPLYKSKQRILGKVREIVNIRAALASIQADVIVTRAAGPHVGLIRFFTRRRKFVYSSGRLYAWYRPTQREASGSAGSCSGSSQRLRISSGVRPSRSRHDRTCSSV